MAKPRIVSLPSGSEPSLPKPPSWWRTFGLKTGTIVEHDGVTWILVEVWGWTEYEGRTWERVTND